MCPALALWGQEGFRDCEEAVVVCQVSRVGVLGPERGWRAIVYGHLVILGLLSGCDGSFRATPQGRVVVPQPAACQLVVCFEVSHLGY